MTFSITVSAGAPATDIEPGTYVAVLSAIDGPKTIIPRGGPNPGQPTDILEWTFATDEAEVQGITSAKYGPNSKTVKWLTAILGTAPAVGQTLTAEQLIGREVQIVVAISDSGWPKVTDLVAMPKRPGKPVAKPAPVAPVEQAADGDLPF
jgi:hypothetical protein